MVVMYFICRVYFMLVMVEDYFYSKNKIQFQSVYWYIKFNMYLIYVYIYFELFLIIVNN